MLQEVFIVGAVRTAIGSFGGALREKTPGDLASAVTREVLKRSGVAPERVDHVVFGQVIPTEPKDAYLGRVASIGAGIPHGTPAMTVNRLCGSGLQAILSAAHYVSMGDAQIVVGGGAEVMSRAPFLATAMRWGQRMGDAALVDALNGALTDPFGNGLMGVTAENVADKYRISRQEQDAQALQSQQRAAAAIAAGHFKGQIVPIEVRERGRAYLFEVDEYVREGTTLADLEKLRPIFRKENGSVTAGNASGINDGAAALVLASASAVREHGLTPLARLVAYGHAGVDPAHMGIGPVPATRIALERAGLNIADLDVIESNEAFASQACAVVRELGLDSEKVNPNGSGIALGHPVGATGAIITTKLVHELHRTGGRFGLATMCIGGGQGIAAIFERV
jgi:acetyl-CoA C-acetyltransferase